MVSASDGQAVLAKSWSDDESRQSGNLDIELRDLALRTTATCPATPEGQWRRVLFPESGSSLDPQSPAFDGRLWVKTFFDHYNETLPSRPRSLGVAYRDLTVCGDSSGAQHQASTGNIFLSAVESVTRRLGGVQQSKQVTILRDFEGVLDAGELLLVLGPPGSGCSTLLKTIAGETAGLKVSPETKWNYRGIDEDHVRSRFRGDVLYNGEIDTHLAHLTVGETLRFAASTRPVRNVPAGFAPSRVTSMLCDVVMSVFGIAHTVDTRVGDDFVRGVSGGERKRVSIAESALTGALLQCWDNSTRGLDSANAVRFCQSLRDQAKILNISAAVAIYQAPQSAYDLFDRVTVLYKGRQIFFGKISEAAGYFENLGFERPERQTTPDFLTSMTSPAERVVRAGFEGKVPKTPDEFAECWKNSKERQALLGEIQEYQDKHPRDQRALEYKQSRAADQQKHMRSSSPYLISFFAQVKLNIWRAFRRLVADPFFTIASMLYNLIMAVMLGSMFFEMKADASTFYYRGGIIFFALLFNAFASQLEVLTVYAERPVIEKHNRYALYRQSSQAVASYLMDLPYKTANMFVFNIVIYWMTNLRRDAGAFFFFCLTSYLTTLVMSALFRTLAYLTRTPAQAMVPGSLLSLGLMIYTGFCIPPSYIPDWSRWMMYINPLSYAFEALMASEFHDREFPCSNMVPRGPGYENLPAESQICSSVGAEAGRAFVNGDRYIGDSFGYSNENKWRNIGILCAFLVGLFVVYALAAEFAKPPRGKGEVLVFRRGKGPSKAVGVATAGDIESQHDSVREGESLKGSTLQKSATPQPQERPVFHWNDVCYDVDIKGTTRRILSQVDGWVQPGKSTALMGFSGAGKTTLLDVLAGRVTTGVLTGETLINGRPTDASFQHCVGYVKQQDVHLETMTVREALDFSALLRQPASVPRADKLRHVDRVVAMLEMDEFAGAVIGVPGQGLNVEQRKRLTIGVELAARPELLIFLDEPTSGLDSQTSWAICDLIERLRNDGQAVLCTIHQPSALLFQRFDRLLLLAPGGKTVYFGDLGEHCLTLIRYLERNGAAPCPSEANPAEWMLDVIKPPLDGSEGIDWHEVWRASPEYEMVKDEMTRLHGLSTQAPASSSPSHADDTASSSDKEFAASFATQFFLVLDRTGKHFWRSPTYIWSKFSLIGLSCLYLGFSFDAHLSLQGMQNQLYAIYLFFILFSSLNEQIMPMFVPQRALYEVRERPSKMYRWTMLLLANILVEMAWNVAAAAIAYICWYYPVGFSSLPGGNSGAGTDDLSLRGFLVFLFIALFLLFTCTFSHMAIAWNETAETAGVLASLLYIFCIAFSGVGVAPADLPQFWTFMYRVSPVTYMISGVMSSAMSGYEVTCAPGEVLRMVLPSSTNATTTCADFLAGFVAAEGGRVLEQGGGDGTCAFCPLATTDAFLARFGIEYADRWRNFGLLWVYIFVNIGLALGLYWVFRVPKGKGMKRGV
ncbi:multidrug resistance protein CDR1 [Microdochium trichocladiopsis]|uniref:Multidrug resistance protein CDR1 n=1 Tax=Microdochium trichocladiopsis TaxID=1682393 RepID=A0A9P9BNZ4_9PEZI|nr:multidrug resistance protein CDR1 [Microdochium trichocladiopsis]KAH7028749.1 multidrug resistance protein CDR1 [Microdochium trichocladiopsis]